MARRRPPSRDRKHSGSDLSSDDGDFDKGRYCEQRKHGRPIHVLSTQRCNAALKLFQEFFVPV